jgi:hypothetical protein
MAGGTLEVLMHVQRTSLSIMRWTFRTLTLTLSRWEREYECMPRNPLFLH